MSTQKVIGNFTYDTFIGLDGVTGLPYSSVNPMPVSASVTPAADYTASGSITAANANLTSGTATANSTVATSTLNGVSTADILVAGTFSATLVVQVSVNGSTWVSLPSIINVGTAAAVASITTAGTYQVSIPASSTFRVTASAYTSGTAVVSIRASSGVSASSTSSSQSLPSAILAGQIAIAVTNTAVNLPSNTLTQGVIVKAKTSNSATGFVGTSSVNTADTGSGNGYALMGGEAGSWACSNTNLIWVNGTAGSIFYWTGS